MIVSKKTADKASKLFDKLQKLSTEYNDTLTDFIEILNKLDMDEDADSIEDIQNILEEVIFRIETNCEGCVDLIEFNKDEDD